MKARELLEGVNYEHMRGRLDTEVTELVDDSRAVTEGALFICRRGPLNDGHRYIDDAMCRGAAGIILTEDVVIPDSGMNSGDEPFVVRMYDYRSSIGRLCNNFWNFPADKLNIIGVTGTKGKTTVTYMIRDMLEKSGLKSGLIGTIETDDCRNVTRSSNTTPGILSLYRTLAHMVDNGATHCVMEVSSQGLMHSRISGIHFAVAVYTNVYPDHISSNEHDTFEEYVRWKEQLFTMCSLAVINADDMYVECFRRTAENLGAKIITYGKYKEVNMPDYACQNVHRIMLHGMLGTDYRMSADGDGDRYITVGIPGVFNVYNSLAAFAVGDILGIPYRIIQNVLGNMSVMGRLEAVNVSRRFGVYIDYAHNADSLRGALSTLRQYDPNRLICLYGCGGNRSRKRRTGMGCVSGELADVTIITSDNPRYERPEDIISDIEAGVVLSGGDYIKITDRKEAVRYALVNAEPGDIILLAGKGHETYQDVGGHRIHMDERELIYQILEEEDAGTICGCDN